MIYLMRIQGVCAVCGEAFVPDGSGCGYCCNCGWYNDPMNEQNPDEVIPQNLIRLNRAKKLYSENKPFLPDIYDFVSAFMFYGEMQFKLRGKYYGVVKGDNGDDKDILMDWFEIDGETVQLFHGINDFIENAKVGDERLKDIWDETYEVNWLQ